MEIVKFRRLSLREEKPFHSVRANATNDRVRAPVSTAHVDRIEHIGISEYRAVYTEG